MKKIILIIALFLGIALSVTAQNSNCNPQITLEWSTDTLLCPGSPSFIYINSSDFSPSILHKWFKNDTLLDEHNSYNYINYMNTKPGDKYYVKVIDSAYCFSSEIREFISNEIIIQDTNLYAPEITLESDIRGVLINFTAFPKYARYKTSYEWFVNGISQGLGSTKWSSTNLNKSDLVKVVMYSDLGCENPYVSESNVYEATPCDSINTIAPTIVLSTPNMAICAGTQVTFSTITTNEGAKPSFIWQKNGEPILGETGNTYTSSSVLNGDSYSVEFRSSSGCVTISKALSNEIVMKVHNGISGGTIGTDQTICYNTFPSKVIEINPTTSLTNLQIYDWEVSNDSISWQSFSSTSKELDFINPLKNDLYIRRVVTDFGSSEPCDVAYSNWIKIKIDTNQSCLKNTGDFPTFPTFLTNNLIVDSTIKYLKGRNSNSICQTASTYFNTIDTYYSFIANNKNANIELTVGNPAWLSLIELLDTLNYDPISNICLNNIDIDQLTRNYNFTDLTVGQKYLIRLELGDIVPLGHARMEAVNNTFSLKLNSGVTSISDNSEYSNKTISNIYNLQGLEVSKDFRGLVIYKYTDGTTQKVVQE